MTIFAKSYLSNSSSISFHFNNLDSITIYSLCCLKNAFFVLVDNKTFMKTRLSLFFYWLAPGLQYPEGTARASNQEV